LNGKQDLIPGKTNVLQLEATEPGTYRGFCAEFCGIQHTLMQLLIVAQPAEEFTAWLDERRRPPSPPADPLALEGQRLYTTTGCSSCHPIGDAARASVTGPAGPDLGHLATRRTLASGIVENSPANRAAWIVAPDAIKPGTTMPATSLDSEQLRALLAYLDTLR
jgi:cytochrome c oxidase subunit 2